MSKLSCFVVLALLAVPQALHAQTATAFKTGERVTGGTKQCYYRFAGNHVYTHTVASHRACPATLRVPMRPHPVEPPGPRRTTDVIAHKVGEHRTGETKQCLYRYAGELYTLTFMSHRSCPPSIRLRRNQPGMTR